DLPRRITISSAAFTEGTSRATIRRFRASNDNLSSPQNQPRHFHQPLELRTKQIGSTGVGNIVHLIEGTIRPLYCHLLGYHQCAAAEFEDLTQCHQRAEAASATGRSRRNRKHASLESGIGWVTPFAHPRYPVDGILEHWRYRCAVFGAGDKDTVMSHDHLFELERVGGLTTARVEIGFIDRQRVVRERDTGDIDVEQRQLFCCQPGKLYIV